MSLCRWVSELMEKDPQKRKVRPPKTVPPKPPVVEAISLSYPRAVLDFKDPKTVPMKTRGEYPLRYPEGAVVHYNAGNSDQKGFMNYMRRMGYLTFLIDRDGYTWQDFPLNKWGHHAGRSEWRDIKGTVNSRFVGIEVMSAGRLTMDTDEIYRTYWGLPVEKEEVRCSFVNRNIAEGCYHKFLPRQVEELTALILWLESNGQGIFKLENVVGHDEVSPGRKVDPGGALPFTMPAYRAHLIHRKRTRS